MAKKKTEPVIEPIEFPEIYIVVGADLSLRRPGWCKLYIKQGKIIGVQLFSLDNKAKKKTHGQMLREIYDIFGKNVSNLQSSFKRYFVREKMIMNLKVPSERDVAKVVGVMDLMLNDQEWYEIYPVTVKKLVAGSGKAEKSEVAAALEKYIGKQDYKCDDESDAAAVAIAWLIQQGQIKEIE